MLKKITLCAVLALMLQMLSGFAAESNAIVVSNETVTDGTVTVAGYVTPAQSANLLLTVTQRGSLVERKNFTAASDGSFSVSFNTGYSSDIKIYRYTISESNINAKSTAVIYDDFKTKKNYVVYPQQDTTTGRPAPSVYIGSSDDLGRNARLLYSTALGSNITGGRYVSSVDVMMAEKCSKRISSMTNYYGNETDTNTDINHTYRYEGYYIEAGADGTIYAYAADNSTNQISVNKTVLCTYETGVWYNIEAVADLDTLKLEIYVNGERKAAGTDMYLFAQKNYNRLFDTWYMQGSMYLDNLYVYKGAAEKTGFASCSGAVSVGGEPLAEFTVRESSGYDVDSCLVQRGFPIKRGIIYPQDIIEAVCGGETVPTQTKVMEKYSDGSVKWLAAAFEVSLKAGEQKECYLKVQSVKTDGEKLEVSEENGEITVENEVMTTVFGSKGIKSIIFGGKEMLSEDEKSVCTDAKGTFTASGGVPEIVESGDVFVKVRINMPYGGSSMRCEKFYTINVASSRIMCETVYVSYNGTYTSKEYRKTTLSSLYDSYSLSDNFTDITYEYESGESINSCGYVKAAGGGNYFTIVSRDIKKFRGAIGSNGFLNNGSEVICAPLIYSGEYEWGDGYSRTVRHEIILGDANPAAELKLQENAPEVSVNPNAFVKAGILQSSEMSSAARRQAEEIKWAKEKNYGKMEAGAIPFFLDSEKNLAVNGGVMLGEVDYNTWYGVMASGDGELFDIAQESTLCWIDLMIYEGVETEARGIPRYRVLQDNINSLVGHAYYGEFSNVYIAYLMTGNERFKEKCYELADTMYTRSMQGNKMSGYYIGKTGTLRGDMSYNLECDEIRNSFVIRALQNASVLFEDTRFSFLAEQIGGWTAAVQEEDGSWPQLIGTNGEAVSNNGSWIMYKNYIMLYSIRGHCEYYRLTKNSKSLNMIKKFGDYLINEMDGRGWMWDPCGDKEKCETGEDYSRGKAPMQELMASEVFELLYEETGDEKYFKSMCEALQNYLACARRSGFASQRYNDREYMEGSINNAISGQNTTLLRMDSTFIRLFKENRELAERLGFKELALIFGGGAQYTPDNMTSNYAPEEVTANYYQTDTDKFVLIGNNSGKKSLAWKKDVNITVQGSTNLWSGAVCRVQPDKLTISKELNYFDTAVCTELPIEVETDGGLVCKTLRYDSEAVVISAKGTGTGSLRISNGEFEINDSDTYHAAVIDKGAEKLFVVTKASGGGLTAPENRRISFSFSINTQPDDDLYNQWR